MSSNFVAALLANISASDFDKPRAIAAERTSPNVSSDALILLTEWKEFQSPDLEVLQSNEKTYYIVIDGGMYFRG